MFTSDSNIKWVTFNTNFNQEQKDRNNFVQHTLYEVIRLEKGDLCLNAPKYRDMFRFYVPQGSTLTKMTGSEIDPLTYDELGKTVFEGFYGDKYPLYAKSSSKTSVQYTSSVPASYNFV